jgi:IMP dehydrogenase
MKKGVLPKDIFFSKIGRLGLSLTYDDVKLRTGRSEVMPNDVDITSKFSRNTPLLIPVVSAAMDTVTESAMAIGMAKLGGLGVLHKNLTPEEQAAQAGTVKNHLNGLIRKPICFQKSDKVEYILARREEKGYSFHSFPILDDNGRLVGLITEDDFDFCTDNASTAGKIMTRKLITASADTTLKDAYQIMLKSKKKILPLVDKANCIVGLYTLNDVKRILTKSQATYNVDKNGQLRVAAAIGVGEDAYRRAQLLTSEGIDALVIDTAHADSHLVIETLKTLKKKYDVEIVVGNVSEADSTRRLIRAGADGIKIGQGPGAICTTGVVAGVGAPQLTAIYECSKMADKYGIPVCGDGGLRYSGDVPKAIGAGASSVMMGSMLAGTTESPGKIEFQKGARVKTYRGMGSLEAMASNKGSRERYQETSTGKDKMVPEGVSAVIPYVGDLAQAMIQYIGGLRKGMGYVGAADIEELRQKGNFRWITQAGKDETHPHNVQITSEAPNYHGK